MKLGIVGLPNVGKSTLFNSLTKAGAESANYPFCTIDPNVGVVAVPDERLKLLGDLYHSKKVTPAVIEFVDIAGLVKGASKGEGLGNQFLSNIREVDAIVEKIYVLDGGKSLMLALSQDLSQNRPAEAREHVRRFHELFFTLSPEKSAIEHNVKRALLLADKSAYNYYQDFAEKGFYNRLIAGNINQSITPGQRRR